MSSTTNAPAPTTSRPTHIATFLFVVAVVFFLIAGLAIVTGQIAALVAGDATGARNWADALGPYAFGGASISGLLSFALSYRTKQNEGAEDDTDGE
ncbi:hypothetical protein OU415_11690 [Saccharopolyspora sp. WRP15-2]|uniref:Uncharacterized protein n=1 Tax=Saccharopolyspora oryzae TaxID=2997343 RepID=A0ABT4UWK9_9PSEU|nr:hypothetical protein [Saccharopolyspora oryzae]MDA3626099.1 hypothetical protein [Saccharopolyspora oryzae]